ncbi:hypothetical protein V8E55_002008 [Tylopilus felleus]
MSVPYRQDMPPPGGFEAVRYKRNLPFRGPSGLAILGAVTAVCAYGFYRVGKGNLERRCVCCFHKWRVRGPQAVKRGFSWCAHRKTCHRRRRIRPSPYRDAPESGRARKSAFSQIWTLTIRFPL